jgi:acyl-coenzyme A synthetase/AMP-(fatty) acid ligase
VPRSDPQNHLLWPLIAENLAQGRRGETALAAGERAVSYGGLAAAVERGGEEIDAQFAAGARVLVAARNQLHVGVALLAVLRSRAIPLLADPTSVEQLRAIAGEWRASGAIGERDVLTATGLPIVDAVRIESWLAAAPGAPPESLPPAVDRDEPAFWTFTSGTTGEPKAVVHAHRGPSAACAAFAGGVLHLGPEDVTISTAGLPFVYALGNNLFFPLMVGGTAVLPADLLLPTVLGELVRQGASVLVAGPWSLAAIARLVRRTSHVEALRRLRIVLSAGEPLPERVFREWGQRFGKQVLDNLGCTEMFNSFISSVPGRARADSLGFAVPGFEVRVGWARAVPGARGALAVRGGSRAIAVGRNGELTAPEGEWCETGDEVEVDARGAFVFLGRSDDRFKVQGQFVRPVEIERCLAAVDGVAECLVAPERDASGLPVVVARIVAAEAVESADLVRRVLRHARERLPPFAVPKRVDLVAALGRSDRGKLERRPAR